jgi:hypothetical protein
MVYVVSSLLQGEQYDHKETLYLDHYDATESVTSSGKGKVKISC